MRAVPEKRDRSSLCTGEAGSPGRQWLLCAFLWLAAGQTAPTQADEGLLAGSRPLALGGAFAAIADDANALLYNPAGLQALRQHEVAFVNADLFGTGIQTTYFAYALPISRRQAIGFDWQHLGFGDEELDYSRDLIKAALSHRLHPNFSVGASFKYLVTDMSLDRQSVGKGSGVGFDVGVLAVPLPRLRVGFSVHDASETGVTYEGGGSSTLLPRTVRAGLAWEARKDLLLAADVDRKLHLGGEYRFRESLVFRLGAQKDLKTSDPLELAFGVGLGYRALHLDLAHAPGREGLGATQYYGLAVSFDPASSPVQIVGVEGEDLFASYYKKYDEAPVGTIRLQNRSDKSLECRLTVSSPGYEKVPFQETLIVRKGDRSQEVPLRLSLSEKVLEVAKDATIPVQVEVEYATPTKTRRDRQSARMVLYGRGALLWDDIGRAAAFVTSRDPEVEKFARHISHQVSSFSRVRHKERNIAQAGAVFEALRRYGIQYQVDPNNPYVEAVNADWPFDNIQYPRQLLQRRTGDCDDCTVLYCSLLENLGIPTGVVDVPGHIFAVFDTGVDSAQVQRLGIPPERLLQYRGRLWVPVETTLWGKPFAEVWEAGLKQLRDLPDWEGRIRPVGEAWLEYPPAEPSFEFTIEETALQQSCDSAVVASQVEALNVLKEEFVNQQYRALLATSPNDPEAHFELAYVYISLNMLEEARAHIHQAAELSGDMAQVENYLGNTYFLGGDLKAAMHHYQRAVEIDPNDPGLRENLERAMERLLEEERARQP